jgi:hypothetical protein
MVELSVAQDIAAPPDRIWKTLTDLPRFKEWNPFIRAARGTPAVGNTLLVRVRSALRVPLFFRPRITVCDENKELRWRGVFLHPRIAAGDHTFSIERGEQGTSRFVQREVFTGFLPSLLPKLLEREVRKGFEIMNQALKARVEAAAS